MFSRNEEDNWTGGCCQCGASHDSHEPFCSEECRQEAYEEHLADLEALEALEGGM